MGYKPPDFNVWKGGGAQEFPQLAEAYFLAVRDFYDSRARWHRRFYRASGNTVIILGGALPLIVASGLQRRDLVVALIGFVVATMTALRGFYRWDTSWVLLRRTEIELTRNFLRWKAGQAPDTDAAALRADAAILMETLIEIRENEAKNFFRDLPVAQVTDKALEE